MSAFSAQKTMLLTTWSLVRIQLPEPFFLPLFLPETIPGFLVCGDALFCHSFLRVVYPLSRFIAVANQKGRGTLCGKHRCK